MLYYQYRSLYPHHHSVSQNLPPTPWIHHQLYAWPTSISHIHYYFSIYTYIIQMGLKLLTLNANGLNHLAKWRAIWKEAVKHEADILTIQETHFQKNETPLCSHPSFPHVFLSSTGVKKHGVLLAIKDSVDFVLHESLIDDDGRYIILICSIENTLLTIVALYAPNTHPLRFLKSLLKKVSKMRKGNLVLCGDFNIVPDQQIDSSSVGRGRPISLCGLLHTEDLYDIWRCLHGNEKDFTFFFHRHKSYSRIDLILADKWLLQRVTSVGIQDITCSHGLIGPRPFHPFCSLMEVQQQSGPGLWIYKDSITPSRNFLLGKRHTWCLCCHPVEYPQSLYAEYPDSNICQRKK